MLRSILIGMCMSVLVLCAKAGAPTWSVNPNSYAFSLNITGIANVDCQTLSNPNNLIGAFVGGVCRGVVNTNQFENGNYLGYLSVFSNTSTGETITFQIYDASLDSIYEVTDVLEFVDGSIYGNAQSPYVFYSNNLPSAINLSSASIIENVTDPVVGTLNTIDDDSDGFTYSLVEGEGSVNNDQFTIVGNELRGLGSFDYEVEDSLWVRISSTDGSTCNLEQAFLILVTDANDVPTNLSLDKSTIKENLMTGTVVGRMLVDDEDEADTHTFELLTELDHSYFDLSETGELRTNTVFDYESKSTLSIKVSVSDAAGAQLVKTFVIMVVDMNDVPSEIQASTLTIPENESIGFVAATLSVVDQDAGNSHSLSFFEVQGNANQNFTLVNNELRTNEAFDFEEDGIQYVYIQAVDDSGAVVQQQLVFQISDRNDHPTGILLNQSKVDENIENKVFVGLLTSIDQDESDAFTYSLVDGIGAEDNSAFMISSDSLFAIQSFDFESDNSLSIRIQTSDNLGADFSQAINLTVNDKNDPPIGVYFSGETVGENLPENEFVGVFTTADLDAVDAFSYRFDTTFSNHYSKFRIVDNALLTASEFDFEEQTKYNIRVISTDKGGAEVSRIFQISIDDFNDRPTNLFLSTHNFEENLSPGTEIIALTTEDQDSWDKHVYQFDDSSPTDNEDFIIVDNKVLANGDFNFEAKNLYVIKVETIDSLGERFSKQFILNLLDGNDAPTDIELQGNVVIEGQIPGVFIGLLSTTDEDLVDQFNYQLISGIGAEDNGNFFVRNDSLFAGITFNLNEQRYHYIRVRSVDLDGAFTEKNFVIQVSNSNDKPLTIEVSNLTIEENYPKNSLVGQLTTIDPDSIDSHQYSLVPAYGDNDFFKVQGSSLLSNAVFDFETKNSYQIKLQSKDAGNDTVQVVFTIDIQDNNDRPDSIHISTSQFNENLAEGTSVLQFSTDDQDANDEHTYSFNNDQASDNSWFILNGNTLKVNAAFDYESKSVFVIRVTSMDLSGATLDKQFQLQLMDVNDAPTEVLFDANPIVENGTLPVFAGLLSAVDQDEMDSHVFALANGLGGQDNDQFEIKQDSLFFTGSANFEQKQSYQFRVQATDANGLPVVAKFSIEVEDGNDSPTDVLLSNASILENEPFQSRVGFLSSVDEDNNDAFTYSLVAGIGDDDNSKFQVVGNELLTREELDYELDTVLMVRVRTTDLTGAYFEKSFSIDVVDVNDTPLNIVLSTDSFPENLPVGTTIISLTTLDADENEVYTYSFVETIGDDNDLFVIDGTNIRTGVSFNYEEKNMYVINLRVTDQGGAFITQQFLLHVQDRNDSPSQLTIAKEEWYENASPGQFVGLMTTLDEDVSDSHSYQVLNQGAGQDGQFFYVQNDSLMVSISADYESKNEYEVIIRSFDEAGSYTSFSTLLQVKNTNDSPVDISLSNNTISESITTNRVVGQFFTIDQDTTDNHQYTLVQGNGDGDNDNFEIINGQLILVSPSDFEFQSQYSVRVQTQDLFGAKLEKFFLIEVLNINEAPSLDYTIFYVDENTPVGEYLGDINISDPDLAGSWEFVMLGDTSNSVFFVDLQGGIEVAMPLDYEMNYKYLIPVVVTDQGGLKDTGNVTIIVRDVIEYGNELPVSKLISLNGDGKNDFFAIENVELYSNFNVKIFDAQGVLVFSQFSNYTNNWNGMRNGVPVPEGVYYYVVQNNSNPMQMFKGAITIIN